MIHAWDFSNYYGNENVVNMIYVVYNAKKYFMHVNILFND